MNRRRIPRIGRRAIDAKPLPALVTSEDVGAKGRPVRLIDLVNDLGDHTIGLDAQRTGSLRLTSTVEDVELDLLFARPAVRPGHAALPLTRPTSCDDHEVRAFRLHRISDRADEKAHPPAATDAATIGLERLASPLLGKPPHDDVVIQEKGFAFAAFAACSQR